ncbi:MAG: ribokinase [Lachnospiraceae bacterium]
MKIAVVGSMNMDMLVHTSRIPHPGETLRGTDLEYQPGGKGANQAVAMAKLGADVTMYGCLGKDAAGEQILQNMERQGIHMEHVRILDAIVTGQALITIGESDNTIIIIAGANDYVNLEYLEKNMSSILEADIIVLQNEIPQESVNEVIRACHAKRKIIVLNPAPARKIELDSIEKVTYLTPNEHEAELIFGREIEAAMHRYPEKLIVTRGKEGVAAVSKSQKMLVVPALKVEVVDTTGAGDTLNGAFCVGIAGGMDIEEALKFANTAAGLSIQRYGAQTGMSELEEVRKKMQTC